MAASWGLRGPQAGSPRRFDRLEHDLRVGGLGHRFGDMVAPVALMWVVATEFLEERDDLGRLGLGENGERKRELLSPGRELVVVALRDQHHRREEERERRDHKREQRKRERVGR
jgi:hypothetical protein